MYPWDVLGIDATDDKKIIKKAYAKLIRQHRPEDEPEKFQEINQAYKYSISLNSSNDAEVSNELNTDLSFDDISNSELANDEYLEKHRIRKLLKKGIKEMSSSSIHEKNNIDNWVFLEKFQNIIEIDEREKVASYVFEEVAALNMLKVSGFQILQIPIHVAKYMDGIFNWSLSWKSYNENLYDESNSLFLSLIESDTEYKLESYRPSYFDRLGALILDVIISGLLSALAINFGLIESYKLSILIFVVYRLILELSPLKKTIGTAIFNYKFLDGVFHKPTIKNMLIRNLLLFINLLPFYMVFVTEGLTLILFKILLGAEILLSMIVFFIKYHFKYDKRSNTVAIKETPNY